MELRHIKYFVAAAEELNISRASRRLNVSQPAMSRLIHDLEEELAAVLFVRERFGLRLTAAGGKFLVYARQIIDLHNEAVRVVGNYPESSNILNIGFVALSIISSCLGAALRIFREMNPGMTVKIYELSPADQVTALRKKQIDIALFDKHDGVVLDEFEKTVLFEIHLIAVIPETHSLAGQKQISLKELAKDEFIGYCEESYPRRNQAIISACLAAGFKPDMHYHAASVAEVLTMIGSGAGVSLLPKDLTGISHPGVALIAIRERLEPILFTAAWRRNYDSPIIDQLLEHIKLQTSE